MDEYWLTRCRLAGVFAQLMHGFGDSIKSVINQSIDCHRIKNEKFMVFRLTLRKVYKKILTR